MGGSKMIPEVPYGAKPPPKLLWSPMIERPEDEAARKAQIKTAKDSFHQISPETYPCSPFKYRTKLYSFDPGLIPPTIIEQPDLASLKKPCPYRKKMEKAKSKSIKKKSQFLLSKFIKSAVLKEKEIYIWNETFKPERIKVLIKSLASPVELEQLYAAQALGQLGTADESVISALYNTVQESDDTPLQYEAARSLALLGCLETCVMKVLIRHLKVASLNRREDTLAALKVALQAWSITPSFEYYCIGARSSLIRNLKRLVNLEEPLDSITFNAALCLGYLDKSDPIAQETMFMFLTHVERKKRYQALIMLVKHMGIMNAIIIRKVLDHLERSPVYKHRANATDLLTTIGLEIIQQEGLEEDVFIVLLKKVSDEPFLIVRQKIALAIEELKMKMRVWEIVERQLKDENDLIRKHAVITLGVLGIRHIHVFFALLEMLELDTDEAVRIQVIRAFSTLGIDNVNVRKSLKKKKQGGGILGRESSKALEILDRRSEIQKELMVHSFIIQ
ncbi:protein HEATR9 [Pantherophis guttatus]|uniref:Protein HEATR9 n=1 Tax=Pantherophis guttatus TaxID=94885 RepID=A0A6P9BLW4_PANGU|nr:protein HEATR9 [Pantherophis guttatus]